MTRWTARDDRAMREHAEDLAIEEQVRVHVARLLGLDPNHITVTRIVRPRPCTHLRCRVARLWKRVTR